MPARLILLSLVLCDFMWMDAQNFSFAPGADYSGILEMDIYTEHMVYVEPNAAADTAYISWRKMANTCPDGWDLQMCDYLACYSGMPNTGNMYPVPPGLNGYLKIVANPYQIQGSCDVHFWVYPTGMMDQHQDIFFHLQTTPTTAEERRICSATAWFYGHTLSVEVTECESYTILDMSGRQLRRFSVASGFHAEDLSGLPAGIYFCKGSNGMSFRFCKPF